MKERIVVEVRFDEDGTLRPLAFEWEGNRYIVANHGRQWEVDGIQHFLVMTADEQVYELTYLKEENHWILSRNAQDFKPHSTV